MNLHFFILGFISYFEKLSFLEKIETFTAIYFFTFGIAGIFILPIIFNCIIIPKIENRLGRKLVKWGVAADIWIFGKFFMRYAILTGHVVTQYCILKFSKNPDATIKKYNTKTAWASDLSAAGYDIRNASKLELFMSFFTLIYLFSLAIDMFVFWLVSK